VTVSLFLVILFRYKTEKKFLFFLNSNLYRFVITGEYLFRPETIEMSFLSRVLIVDLNYNTGDCKLVAYTNTQPRMQQQGIHTNKREKILCFYSTIHTKFVPTESNENMKSNFLYVYRPHFFQKYFTSCGMYSTLKDSTILFFKSSLHYNVGWPEYNKRRRRRRRRRRKYRFWYCIYT
jgi:hypothetical protein